MSSPVVRLGRPKIARDGGRSFNLRSRAMPLVLAAFGGVGWIILIVRATQAITSYAAAPDVDSAWLYDWRVYYAGALDLVNRALYLDTGISVNDLQMPVYVFNNPPMAAVLPLPFLPFGYQIGGLVWVVAGDIAFAACVFLTVRPNRLPYGVMLVGLLWLVYATQPFFVRNIVLGNVNSLMLLLVVAFAWAHLEGHQRLAGLFLGLAVVIKVWPFVLAVLLVRERRWRALLWAMAFVVVQGVLILLWLGPDMLPAMLGALGTHVPIPPTVVVLWTSWAREALDWWPAWGSLIVAGLLLAIPARGRLGIGLGILAGMSLIANLWDHYLPTFAFALFIIGSSPEVVRAGRQLWSRLSFGRTAASAPTSR